MKTNIQSSKTRLLPPLKTLLFVKENNIKNIKEITELMVRAYEQKDHYKTLFISEHVLAFFPNDELGLRYNQEMREMFKKSIEELTVKIRNKEYDNGGSFYLRGLAYITLARKKMALRDFLKAVEFFEVRKFTGGTELLSYAYYFLASSQMDSELYNQAHATIDKAIKLSGNSSELMVLRSMCYYEQGKNEMGSREIEKMIKEFPDSDDSKRNTLVRNFRPE